MSISRNYLHVLWRVPVLISWMVIMPIVFIVARACQIRNYSTIPHAFHQGVRIIMGLQVHFSGDICQQQPTLFVSNHISYLDVFVLGNIPAYFVAKSEVANWPVLGHFAKFQNTLFIDRSPGKTKQALKVMQEHIAQGSSLILFPEGTSTDGRHVEPFKSSLFETVNLDQDQGQAGRVPIQPITIAYTHQDNKKMDQTSLDYYAWYNNMPFAPHFFKLFALKKVDIKVHFHSICYVSDFETRKQCADHCQKMIAAQLGRFLQDDV